MKSKTFITTASITVITFTVLFATLLNTKVQEDKTQTKQHTVEQVCREWQDTFPQSDIYDDCVKRNFRK